MRIPKSVTDMIAFLSTLLIVYLAMCLALYLFQRQLLFFPVSEVNPAGTKHLMVDTGEATIKVWVVNPGRDEALIYFGGNAENVAYDIDAFGATFPGHTLYLVNYRGFGGSSGSASEAGLYHDALALYDRFSPKHKRFSAMGRSIGAAVAVYLASERKIDRLILVTPFDSALNVGRKLYPFFPMRLIVRDRYDALVRAGRVEAQTLVVAAGSDEIIPRENTLALVRALPQARLRFETLPDTGHNSLHFHPDYDRLLFAFMQQRDAKGLQGITDNHD
jgi:pimeloyl-ACP methyl ester carboxylesterase